MSQPACLEEQKFIITLGVNSSSLITGFCTCCNASGVFTNNSNIFNFILAVSYVFTLFVT